MMGKGRSKRKKTQQLPHTAQQSRWNRLRWPLAAVLLLALAWAIGSAGGMWGTASRHPSPPIPAWRTTDRVGDTHPSELPATGEHPDDLSIPDDGHTPTTFPALRRESFDVVNDLLIRFPEDPLAAEKAAQLAGVFGEHHLAMEHWKRCVQLAPRYMGARYSLIWLALQEGNYEEMARHSRAALAVHPRAAVFQNLLGYALLELGKPQQAKEVLVASLVSSATQSQGEDTQRTVQCDTYTLLGKACLLERDFHQAAEYYDKAVKIDSNWSKAVYGLGTAYARIGKIGQAKELLARFRKLQKVDPVKSSEEQFAAALHDVALIYTNIASIHAHYGNAHHSQVLLGRAKQLVPAAGGNLPQGSGELDPQLDRRVSGVSSPGK